MSLRLKPIAVVLSLAGAGAMLAGCSTPDQSEKETVVQAPLPPLVTGPIDGIYRGRSTPQATNTKGCPVAMSGLLEVGDRQVQFAYAPDLIFLSRVGTNGALLSRQGGYELAGQLRDGHIEATVTGAACATHLSFERLAYF